MYTVDNKFEVGEECYTVCRTATKYKCPFCEDNGKKEYNGYKIPCRNCNGTGKLDNPKETVLVVCKVRIRRLIASIWKDQITIKYKVDCIDDIYRNIRNRGETSLFKTVEEAEKYCVEVNTKQVTPEF